MSGRVNKHEAFLDLLSSTNPIQRKALIRTASEEQLRSVCECALNILRQQVHLSPKQIAELRKHRSLVYKLADRSIPIPRKRKLLEQSGGVLPALLVPVLSSVLGAVASKIFGG